MKVVVLFLAANTFSSLQHKASQQQDIEGIWMLSEDGKCHNSSHNPTILYSALTQFHS